MEVPNSPGNPLSPRKYCLIIGNVRKYPLGGGKRPYWNAMFWRTALLSIHDMSVGKQMQGDMLCLLGRQFATQTSFTR